MILFPNFPHFLPVHKLQYPSPQIWIVFSQLCMFACWQWVRSPPVDNIQRVAQSLLSTSALGKSNLVQKAQSNKPFHRHCREFGKRRIVVEKLKHEHPIPRVQMAAVVHENFDLQWCEMCTYFAYIHIRPNITH